MQGVASPSHWMTQEEISHVARISYGLHNDTSQGQGDVRHRPEVHFDVVGSHTHLAASLSGALPALEEQRVAALTYIINLNANHWVTVVVTRDPTSNRYLALYADSFGVNPCVFPRPGACVMGEEESLS